MAREGEAACQKANPKEHYPPRLGARCLALPLASLREFVGWGTVRGLGMKREMEKIGGIQSYSQLTLTVRITQSLPGTTFPSPDTRTEW